MQKNYTSIGLMSGTSGDGVDASIIYSDGVNEFKEIEDKYFEYDSAVYKNIHSLKEKIFNKDDLKKLTLEIKDLERRITIFHAKIIKEFKIDDKNTLIGFHGQTIYHNSSEKISLQLGDGKLLNQLIKKKIICNFRKNDILNGGEGAPLTPVFHKLITSQKKIALPVCILNIGGIANITILKNSSKLTDISSKDIGPGNCLIDSWIRKNSDFKFDKNGKIASIGKKNEIIFEQGQELYFNRKNKNKNSFDTSDFDISFARGLSLEDGTATLTEFTASILGERLSIILKKELDLSNILICGGGRKNTVLINLIKKNLPKKYKLILIDDYGVNGDFVESQAFAYLAIRSYKKLPITFPNTTNCNKPLTGGELLEN